LDALIKAKPHLAKSPNGKPPAPKDETPSDDPNKWMREAIYGRSR
jgi:ribosomal protein L1